MNETFSTQTTDENASPGHGRGFPPHLVCGRLLVTLIALYYAERIGGENLHGINSDRMEAKGEKFDLQSFVPPRCRTIRILPDAFLAPLLTLIPPSPARSVSAKGHQRLESHHEFAKRPRLSGLVPPFGPNHQPTDLQAWAVGIQKKMNGKEAPVPLRQRGHRRQPKYCALSRNINRCWMKSRPPAGVLFPLQHQLHGRVSRHHFAAASRSHEKDGSIIRSARLVGTGVGPKRCRGCRREHGYVSFWHHEKMSPF